MDETAIPGDFAAPYAAIARLMQRRRITLFIGAAASLVGAEADRLPDGRQFAGDLMRLSSYPGSSTDPLAKVAQYLVEAAGDRDLVLDYIRSRFHDDISQDYKCSLTEFLAHLRDDCIPALIVSTNYDTLVERTFERRSAPYVCVSHVLGRSKYAGRLVVYDNLRPLGRSDIMTRAEAEEYLQDKISSVGTALTIIYKMHGSAVSYIDREQRSALGVASGLNTIVVTEQDYIDFLDKSTFPRIPIQIQKLLFQAQFVFLGYSLSDWNFRLLLHRLREGQEGADTRHWACLLQRDPVEVTFWQKRGVNIYHVSLDRFLANLMQTLEGGV
ncbi:MAG TPA: SIR2 family protein [Acetobacteraceae bacterium]|jgi:hypothetical protein